MKNQASTVNDYLAQVQTSRREALTRLRNHCRDALRGNDETIAFGMPTFARDGQPEIAYARQKNHIALNVMKLEVLERHHAGLPDCGKSCARYREPEQVDFSVVERLLQDAATSPTTPRRTFRQCEKWRCRAFGMRPFVWFIALAVPALFSLVPDESQSETEALYG